MKAVTQKEAIISKTRRDGGLSVRYDYFGKKLSLDQNPQGFLVERYYPNPLINPHFHDVDEFQLVVGGHGRIGKWPVKPFSFHYTDAYTPYGPIVGDEDGIAFLTLRNCASGGHWTMPGNRHLMPGHAGRHFLKKFETDICNLNNGEVKTIDLIESFEDGLRVCGYYLGPGAEATALETNAGGQYHIVLGEGFLLENDKVLPSNTIIHVNRGEEALQYKAGPKGASVLCMQFALPGDRPGSNPGKIKRDNYVEL